MTAQGYEDAHLYNRAYFYDRSYGRDLARDAMYEQERARIIKRSNFGNILDVGCGMGYFLEGMDDRFEKYGIEPSDYASQKAREKGINMLPNINMVDFDSMDTVVFRGTLQHINTPIQDLSHAARILKRGGTLAIIATPDADSLVYKIWGELPPLDWPRNWIIFGHKELKNILSRLGFVDIEILYPYWGGPYAHPVRDFWNFFVSLFFGYRKFAFPGNMIEIYCRKP